MFTSYCKMGDGLAQKNIGFDVSTNTVVLNPLQDAEWTYDEFAKEDHPEWHSRFRNRYEQPDEDDEVPDDDVELEEGDEDWEREEPSYRDAAHESDEGEYEAKGELEAAVLSIMKKLKARKKKMIKRTKKQQVPKPAPAPEPAPQSGQKESTGAATFGGVAPKVVEYQDLVPTIVMHAGTSGDVKQARRKRPGVCFNCGKTGHGYAQCPESFCINCQQKGHYPASCPKAASTSGEVEAKGKQGSFAPPHGLLSVFDGEAADGKFVCHATLIQGGSGTYLMMPKHGLSAVGAFICVSPSFGPTCGKQVVKIDKKVITVHEKSPDGFAVCKVTIAGLRPVSVNDLACPPPDSGDCAVYYKTGQYTEPLGPITTSQSTYVRNQAGEYVAHYSTEKGACGTPVLSHVDGKIKVVGFHYFGLDPKGGKPSGNLFLPLTEGLVKFFTDPSAGSQ